MDDHVRSGMVVGLGTGSTAYFAVERVGQKLKSGELKDIICIPTSLATEKQAKSLGIPLCTLNERSKLDVAIDGADAVDPDLCLIKGGGGALLREKMVEVMSKKFICIVDESKLCKGLGPSFPLPVEITPFCHEHTMRVIAALPELKGCEAVLRTGDCSNNKPDGNKPAVELSGHQQASFFCGFRLCLCTLQNASPSTRPFAHSWNRIRFPKNKKKYSLLVYSRYNSLIL